MAVCLDRTGPSPAYACREVTDAGGGLVGVPEVAFLRAGCLDLGATWRTTRCPTAGKVGTCVYTIPTGALGGGLPTRPLHVVEHLFPPRADGPAFCDLNGGAWTPG